MIMIMMIIIIIIIMFLMSFLKVSLVTLPSIVLLSTVLAAPRCTGSDT